MKSESAKEIVAILPKFSLMIYLQSTVKQVET